jgi:hypothetical protein
MISPESKMRSPDRILKLEPMEGKKTLNSMGIVDPRLFKDGEDGNQLHAVMDIDSCLWSFRYEKGSVPPALKGTFTGFRALKKYAEEYFTLRNIKITEVKD